jgi:hypothetical protein
MHSIKHTACCLLSALLRASFCGALLAGAGALANPTVKAQFNSETLASLSVGASFSAAHYLQVRSVSVRTERAGLRARGVRQARGKQWWLGKRATMGAS